MTNLTGSGRESLIASRRGEPVFGNSIAMEHLADSAYLADVCGALGITLRDAEHGMRVRMAGLWTGERFAAYASSLEGENGGIVLFHQSAAPRLAQASLAKMTAWLKAAAVFPNVLWVDATLCRSTTQPVVSGFAQGYRRPFDAIMGLVEGGYDGAIATILAGDDPLVNRHDYAAWFVGEGDTEVLTAPSCYELNNALREASVPEDVLAQVGKIKLYKKLRYL